MISLIYPISLNRKNHPNHKNQENQSSDNDFLNVYAGRPRVAPTNSFVYFLPNRGVAEERERLLSESKAGIASFFRRKG